MITVIYNLKFIDSYRFMSDSLSRLVDNLSEINKKEPENEFIDSMRSMTASLSSLIDDVSEINKKQPKNEFIDSMSLCLLHYQVVLMICQRLIKKNQKMNLLIA